jgi:hypothetical protein
LIDRTTTSPVLIAHSDLQIEPSLGAQLLGIALYAFLHPERGVQSSLWVILVRDRGAEQCEDPIAGRLHDVTAVAMRRIHHEFERWIDDRAGLFGIDVLHQVHRALDVGK